MWSRLGKPEPKPEMDPEMDPELRMLDDEERPESFEVDIERSKEIRRGIDLATTLERIAKNFVITDPRLPDNPIVSAYYLTLLNPISLSLYRSFSQKRE